MIKTKQNHHYLYLEKRFNRRVRHFGSALSIIFLIIWTPISVYVPALTFNMVTGISMNLVVPIVCIVCTFYTSIGGFKGVVWTDVLQGLLMLGTMGLVAAKGTYDLGGLDIVIKRNLDSGRIQAPELTMDPTVRMGFFAVILGGSIFKLQAICISQVAMQRFFSLPNMNAVKKSLIYFIIGFILLLGLCVYMGMLAFANYYDCDPITTGLTKAKDQIVPLYVMEIAGQYPGITGLFVSGVFSAALSSLSSGLNAAAAVILKDFIEPYRLVPLTDRQTAVILRSVVVVFGVTAMALVPVVERLGLVMQLSSTFASMVSGPILGVFTAGILLPFVNTKSVLTGCIIATSILGYIAIRAQYEIATGELKFPTKPVSIDGCTYEFSENLNTTLQDAISSPPDGSLHHISFLCYSLVGSGITLVTSVLASVIFGTQDTSNVDPMLISPVLRRFLKPRMYTAVKTPPLTFEKDSQDGLCMELKKRSV